jgi:H+ antiporter protein
MIEILANRTYRHLFAAQLIALVGTGLATVALSLLAFEIAGGEAGSVLGIALAIKMAAYISVAPIVGAFSDRLPRRGFLIAMDLVRAAVAIVLPFVDQVWQIYLLIFLLQSASAAFTPTFQATIPDILPDERDYTKALSLSRLAYDMESLASPALAAALLALISFHWLFSGTALGFLASALLVATTRLPHALSATAESGIYARTMRGIRIYLRTPRLRGLLAITLAAAAASAMVIVNTVVIVRDTLGLPQQQVAIALAAYGAGSMLAALVLPRLLDRIGDRNVMAGAAAALCVALAAMAGAVSISAPSSLWLFVLVGWFLLGMAYSFCVTPTGRLLRRSAHAEDRPRLFAAQFALSHACWLVAYPLSGWLGAAFGQVAAFAGMALIAAIGTVLAVRSWPAEDPDAVPHQHRDLPADHPHLREAHGAESHTYVIDTLHPRWPDQA